MRKFMKREAHMSIKVIYNPNQQQSEREKNIKQDDPTCIGEGRQYDFKNDGQRKDFQFIVIMEVLYIKFRFRAI